MNSENIIFLDIGSNKIVATFFVLSKSKPEVKSIKTFPSNGFRGGTIVDIKLLESSIMKAIVGMENIVEQAFDHIVTNLSSPFMSSYRKMTSLNVSDKTITHHHIKILIDNMLNEIESLNLEILHFIPQYFSVDNVVNINDPVNMRGNKLGCFLHVIAAKDKNISKYVSYINNLHIDLLDLVATSYASMLGVISKDESDLGATVIDIGEGSIHIAVVYNNKLIHIDEIPIGGYHITLDIAQAFSINAEKAEYIKINQGRAYSKPEDKFILVDLHDKMTNDISTLKHITRAELYDVIKERIHETIELVYTRLRSTNMPINLIKRVILTGGGAKLNGISTIVESIFKCNVRVANPIVRDNFIISPADKKLLNDPIYATTVGMINFIIERFINLSYDEIGATINHLSLFTKTWIRLIGIFKKITKKTS